MDDKIKQQSQEYLDRAKRNAKAYLAKRRTPKVFDHNRLVGDLASECHVIPNDTSNAFTIERSPIKKGDKMTVVSARDALFMGYQAMSCLAPYDFEVVQLKQSGGTWMSDCYQEMFTLAPAIDRAYGDVLIGGLGIGYSFQKMFRKPEVRSITVVEKSRDVMRLVWPYIQRWADLADPAKSKRVLCLRRDLYEYLKRQPVVSAPKQRYDFASLDIWTSTGERDHERHVQPLRKLAQRVMKPGGKIHCWGEETMEGQMHWNGREVPR
ncbi:MAG: hypothetical protein UMS36scaffold28_66 [Phage 59_13]|nr:MAG: hypothetical protein UMS36scaffold28_66 [Phage 59_13]